jgi:hypothetical protein
VVVNGYAYVHGRCLEIATGRQIWANDWEMPANNAEGGVILAGKRLIMLDGVGDLVVAEATPEEYREVAKASIGQGKQKYWSGPALSASRLLVRNMGKLMCFDLR